MFIPCVNGNNTRLVCITSSPSHTARIYRSGNQIAMLFTLLQCIADFIKGHSEKKKSSSMFAQEDKNCEEKSGALCYGIGKPLFLRVIRRSMKHTRYAGQHWAGRNRHGQSRLLELLEKQYNIPNSKGKIR